MVGREFDRKKNLYFFLMFSPPLTVATDGYAMPFLTHEHFSGTGKSKSVYQRYG